MPKQDVAYYLAPEQDARITISLCASAAHSDAFDTKLYVIADLLSPSGTRLTPISCNDDFCGYQSQVTVRLLCCSSTRSVFAAWYDTGEYLTNDVLMSLMG